MRRSFVRRIFRGCTASDEGSVLVFALALLAFFGLVAGTLLSLAQTNVKVTGLDRDDAARTYATDGAIDGAINNLSTTTTLGAAGVNNTSCFTLPATSVAGGSSAFSSNVAVRCLGRSGSAATTTVVAGSQPAQAILAGGTNAGEGVNLTGANVDVQGNVAAKSRVAVPSGSSLGVSGTLAGTTCTVGGTVTANTNSCNTATAATDPGTSDLSWAQPGFGTAASPASQFAAPIDVMPACTATVTMTPASFYSAAALNALFTSCPSATYVFQPGVYLFDFQDTGASTARVWNIANAATTLIGGALNAAGTACNSAVSGVEFVFAGESQLNVTAGSVNLCGAWTDTTPYDATTAPAAPATPGQHIAVYGLKTAGTVYDTNAKTPKSTTISGWTLPAGKTGPQTFASVDGVKASTTITGNGTTSTISAPIGSVVPPDATITDASLSVNYTETGNGSLGFNALFFSGSYYFPIGTLPCNGTCTGPNYTWSCGTAPGNSGTCASYAISAAALNPVTVQVTATDNAAAAFTATIDSITVSFTWTEPMSASSGCLVTAPYPASGCALLNVSGSAPATRLNIDGTVYSWLAPVDLSAKLQTATVVDRGIVARDLQLGMTPATDCQGPLVALAAASTLPRRDMVEASIAGTVSGRAEVCWSDVGGALNGTVPTILSWTHF